jgi:hypothetical protein
MDQLTTTLWQMRNPSGLPMPKKFTETVQSCLNRHTSQSARWDGRPETDLFFSPKKKGRELGPFTKTGPLPWLKAKRLPEA